MQSHQKLTRASVLAYPNEEEIGAKGNIRFGGIMATLAAMMRNLRCAYVAMNGDVTEPQH